MSKPIATRLRWSASKDADLLMSYVNKLPYRIEIKGTPVLKGAKWFLWFILPDDENLKEEFSGDLDK